MVLISKESVPVVPLGHSCDFRNAWTVTDLGIGPTKPIVPGAACPPHLKPVRSYNVNIGPHCDKIDVKKREKYTKADQTSSVGAVIL